MLKLKKEKFFVHVVCNLLIVCLIVMFGFLCFFVGEEKEVMVVSNSEYNGTIYAGDKNSKYVSLMINVYWGTEYVEQMLKILKKYDAKTTFFVGGSWVKDNQELLKTMYKSGHEIASHGTNHKEHGKISYENNLTEIQTCHEIVKHVLGIDMNLFAPPGGSYSKNTTKAADFLGYKTIMWTRDTIDWRDKNTSLIYNRATTNLCGGDLILMHPTANTVEAFSNIIEQCKRQGFQLVTVSKNLGFVWYVKSPKNVKKY